jgi:hypothetical protein
MLILTDIWTSRNDSAIQPLVRDYHSINNGDQVNVRIPSTPYSCIEPHEDSQADLAVNSTEKVATPVKVEAKVWFANERTWISYLSTSIVMSSLSLALYNASRDRITTYFAYVYALM